MLTHTVACRFDSYRCSHSSKKTDALLKRKCEEYGKTKWEESTKTHSTKDYPKDRKVLDRLWDRQQNYNYIQSKYNWGLLELFQKQERRDKFRNKLLLLSRKKIEFKTTNKLRHYSRVRVIRLQKEIHRRENQLNKILAWYCVYDSETVWEKNKKHTHEKKLPEIHDKLKYKHFLEYKLRDYPFYRVLQDNIVIKQKQTIIEYEKYMSSTIEDYIEKCVTTIELINTNKLMYLIYNLE